MVHESFTAQKGSLCLQLIQTATERAKKDVEQS